MNYQTMTKSRKKNRITAGGKRPAAGKKKISASMSKGKIQNQKDKTPRTARNNLKKGRNKGASAEQRKHSQSGSGQMAKFKQNQLTINARSGE